MTTIARGSDGDINEAGPLTVHFAMDCMALWEAIIDFCGPTGGPPFKEKA